MILSQVPDHWKVYVHEVDEEREMWLNSFYRAPLRLPMPAELEHWWSKGWYLFFPFLCMNKYVIGMLFTVLSCQAMKMKSS